MGDIMKVQCSACGAKWECLEGCGMLHGKKEGIIASFLEREREEVTARIGRSAIPAYDFSYQIAVCSHCRKVVNVPVLTTEEDGTYVGLCPACGGEVKFPVSDLEEEACPICKCRTLKAEIDGHWD